MKRTYIYVLLTIISLIALRCKKPYLPDATTTNYNYLVVDGAINSGADSTIIKLSRTVTLAAKTTTKPELKAIVTVQSDQNNTYNLTETTNGNYVAIGLNLDNSRKYRLSIKTTNGKTYLSDYVEVKNAPPIDSIGYTMNSDGITVYNNAHDATNNTRYYRWSYQETWQFQANYVSNYMPQQSTPTSITMVPRTADQQIFTCWASNSSSTILLGSTAKLSQDVIYQNAIIAIPSNSEKIGIKYSIILKQYALTTDAYNFWTMLKKNTEDLGSIFDSQPSAIQGNIHNTADATEPVIGYLSVGTVQSKRVFISKSSLPSSWLVAGTTQCSTIDTLYFSNPKSGSNDVKAALEVIPPLYIAIDAVLGGTQIKGYSRTSRLCGDCTLRGVNKQPAFWK
ncbi:uncharacterized protein DUF4249 [Mucilaginibacter gracilis]|uniref:Uncharacterized protein DUF4249 n=1 Tax=Mucilaginibacter gracilis TaxID=423350 RepID=A0A495J826_9SPHI|nr:DUF4249 domain-containing protein [Mucilaginibacter gracilis]RKR84524.1 uncharacterized protein DUF4249 [Mucilaginibacter gracilis]